MTAKMRCLRFKISDTSGNFSEYTSVIIRLGMHVKNDIKISTLWDKLSERVVVHVFFTTTIASIREAALQEFTPNHFWKKSSLQSNQLIEF